MTIPLFAFTGTRGSGKDTAADLFSAGLRRARVAFADPLKRMALAVGYPAEVLWGPSAGRDTYLHPAIGVTAREFLQKLGTEGVRSVWPDFWIRLAASTVRTLQEGESTYDAQTGVSGRPARRDLWAPRLGQPELPASTSKPAIELITLTDLRFENELATVRELGGKIFCVKRLAQDAMDLHPSETWARDRGPEVADVVIDNSGTLEDLTRTVNLLRRQHLPGLIR